MAMNFGADINPLWGTLTEMELELDIAEKSYFQQDYPNNSLSGFNVHSGDRGDGTYDQTQERSHVLGISLGVAVNELRGSDIEYCVMSFMIRRKAYRDVSVSRLNR